MKPIRFIHQPQNNVVTFNIPEQLKNQKQIEIIIMPCNKEKQAKKKFDPGEFRGAGNFNSKIPLPELMEQNFKAAENIHVSKNININKIIDEMNDALS